MKVLFINDSTSNPNWGDRAAATALKSMIRQTGGDIIGTITEDALKHSLLPTDIASPEQDIDKDRFKDFLRLFIPPIILKVRDKILSFHKESVDDDGDLIPRRWEDFSKNRAMMLRNASDYSTLLDVMGASDMAVIHGDGCMTGNARIARAELFLAYIFKKHFQKPIVLVNHTADFEHPDLHGMAQEVYPLFDDVVYRDIISAERYHYLCPGRFAPDSAFLFKPAAPEEWIPVAGRPTYFDVWPDIAAFDPSHPYICVGGSSIFGTLEDPSSHVAALFLLIKHLRSLYSGQIVLTVSDMIDQKLMRPIANALNLPLIGLSTPVQQAVDIIGNAAIYLGGRWHPSIFALRGGTPIIPISSKTLKMQALVQMSGLSTKTFDALDLTNEIDSIGRQVLNYLEQGNELRVKLRDWAERECHQSWENVAYLRKTTGMFV